MPRAVSSTLGRQPSLLAARGLLHCQAAAAAACSQPPKDTPLQRCPRVLHHGWIHVGIDACCAAASTAAATATTPRPGATAAPSRLMIRRLRLPRVQLLLVRQRGSWPELALLLLLHLLRVWGLELWRRAREGPGRGWGPPRLLLLPV